MLWRTEKVEIAFERVYLFLILAFKLYQGQAKWVKEDVAHLRWTKWFCRLGNQEETFSSYRWQTNRQTDAGHEIKHDLAQKVTSNPSGLWQSCSISLMLLIMSCTEKKKHLRLFVKQNIEKSRLILSLISCKMSLNCTEMASSNDIINDEISFLAIPNT